MDDITKSMDMGLGELWELVMDMEAWRAAARLHKDLDMTEWLNWTELRYKKLLLVVVPLLLTTDKLFPSSFRGYSASSPFYLYGLVETVWNLQSYRWDQIWLHPSLYGKVSYSQCEQIFSTIKWR